MSSPTTTPASAKPAASVHGRSVVDFVTQDELKLALETVTATADAKNDWLLPVPDPEAEEQTLEGEMERLVTLKSFMLLDAEKEEAFDKLTEEACQVFGVPTSLISLIDLGRQFLFSNTGTDVRETPRSVAFCSHTILNKKGIVVVNDTKEDTRFKESELVQEAPFLRFYAGAPLISPEGHKLGTFCVEGPDPRPEGLNDDQKAKLKEYAAKAMELMVERRKNLRDRLSNSGISDELRQHAATASNLGGIIYQRGDAVTAMRLFQESVQTIMYVEEEGQGAKPAKERQEAMSQFLTLLSVETMPIDTRQDLMEKVAALYTATGEETKDKGAGPVDGIPGLFNIISQLKGATTPRRLPGLVFNEMFKIKMVDSTREQAVQFDELPFTVSLQECSKATLFNMGLIHYHWSSPDLALQFFHLAASVSHKLSPVGFDPVDLGCVNNMAQIHLQYRRGTDAKKILEDALTKGNETLANMYSETDNVDDDGTGEVASPMSTDEQEARRTRRLRRKLARTILNVGHVHFFLCDYDAAMACCRDALPLLDNRMEGTEVAAVWYNMSMAHYHKGDKLEALTYLDKYLDLAGKLLGADHVQVADALFSKGQTLYEVGKLDECMASLAEALRIRRLQLDENPGYVAEALCLIGKASLDRQEYEPALIALKECLEIQRKSSSGGPSFEVAQTLLDVGRAYHAKGDLHESLQVYLEAIELTRAFFGADHAFVARIATIIGNLYVESGKQAEAAPFLEEAKKILAE